MLWWWCYGRNFTNTSVNVCIQMQQLACQYLIVQLRRHWLSHKMTSWPATQQTALRNLTWNDLNTESSQLHRCGRRSYYIIHFPQQTLNCHCICYAALSSLMFWKWFLTQTFFSSQSNMSGLQISAVQPLAKVATPQKGSQWFTRRLGGVKWSYDIWVIWQFTRVHMRVQSYHPPPCVLEILNVFHLLTRHVEALVAAKSTRCICSLDMLKHWWLQNLPIAMWIQFLFLLWWNFVNSCCVFAINFSTVQFQLCLQIWCDQNAAVTWVAWFLKNKLESTWHHSATSVFLHRFWILLGLVCKPSPIGLSASALSLVLTLLTGFLCKALMQVGCYLWDIIILISILPDFPQSSPKDFKDFIFRQWQLVRHWESRFSLGLDRASAWAEISQKHWTIMIHLLLKETNPTKQSVGH